VDLKTNTVRSRRTLPSLADLAVPPVLTNDRIVCATADGILAAYPGGDGDPVWKRTFGRQARGAMVEKDGYLYFGDDSGKVRCVSVEGGDVVWERDLQEPVVQRPALRGKDLLIATRNNQLACLRSDDGEPRWTMRTAAELSAPPLALTGGFVLALADGTVGLWTEPGQPPRWTWQSLSPRGVETLAVVNDALFLCSAGGRLTRLSLARGEQLAAAELGGKVLRGPEARGDLLLLLLERKGDDRLLLALSSQDFQLRWQFRTPARVTAGPQPNNGRVWLATDDGNVLGFK